MTEQLPCPGCSQAHDVSALCIHPNPMCWRCCAFEHVEDVEVADPIALNLDGFRDWGRRGWAC